MRTTVEIDEKLLKQAMEASGTKTMKAAIELGLKELVAARRQRLVWRKCGDVRRTRCSKKIGHLAKLFDKNEFSTRKYPRKKGREMVLRGVSRQV